MGKTITRNKKAFHDMPRIKIVPNGTILVDAVNPCEELLLGYKITSIGNIPTAKENPHG